MITLIRTDFHNPHFQELVRALDAELSIMDGDEHGFYAQFNKIDTLRFAVVALENHEPVGCGAIKPISEDTMEVKRMYVSVKNRNRGIAALILAELERWARELNSSKCILETSIKQPDAIALYKKCGYGRIPNYDQYANDKNSICFEKMLTL
jgi:GNAT superfamily N-acetyltransferase